MKKFILSLSILFSLSAHSHQYYSGECVGKGWHDEEHTLTLDLQAMTAEYFDNDVGTELLCQIEWGVMYCQTEKDPYDIMVRVLPDGSAVAVYSYDRWNDFDCLLSKDIFDKMIDSLDY